VKRSRVKRSRVLMLNLKRRAEQQVNNARAGPLAFLIGFFSVTLWPTSPVSILYRRGQNSLEQFIGAFVLVPAPHDYQIMLRVDPDCV
jgi:hypothetical protein